MSEKISIASWNINSVRFRMDIVQRFLREASPDILCLQETKVIDGDFPHATRTSVPTGSVVDARPAVTPVDR